MEGNGLNFSPLVHEGCYLGEGGTPRKTGSGCAANFPKLLPYFNAGLQLSINSRYGQNRVSNFWSGHKKRKGSRLYWSFPYAFYDLFYDQNLIPCLDQYRRLPLRFSWPDQKFDTLF